MLTALLLLGCPSPQVSDSAPPPISEVDWRPGLPPIEEGVRTITHLHSPWSHDACDGEPLIDGVPDESCLQDLRHGLCDAGIDVAFLSDHPAHGAVQEYEDLFHKREGDERVGKANIITCDDGRKVKYFVGFEDELMPLGLAEHVPGTPQERDTLLNQIDADTTQVLMDAGASVFTAHTEQRSIEQLTMLQDAGLTGTEIFNLHAMFSPPLREQFLGLNPTSWFADIAPFTGPTATAEPDLFVLAVLDYQPPSLQRFDALLARGPAVGIVGTDAHQNVLPITLRDNDRADSYRRMLRWMSNIVLTDGDTTQEALAAGRSYVAFEILGTPSGFFFKGADGSKMGSTTTARSLEIGCPTLHPQSPRGLEEPEITVRLLKDGAPFAEGCGSHTVGPGVYRVEIDMIPHHLKRFLGDDPDPWLKTYPWILSNAIRVQ